MRIGILSRNRTLYSTKRLIQSARSRGHDVSVIDTMAVAVEVGAGDGGDDGIKVVQSAYHSIGINLNQRLGKVHYVPQVDAIIPRIGASITQYGLAVVRQFESCDILTTASSTAIAQSRDKLQSLQIMSQAGLPIPRTAVIAQPSGLYAAIQTVGGTPVIVKLVQGTQGRGVLLVPNMATAYAVLDKLRGANRQALVQEFIAEADGKDLRVIVVGDRCVAAMTRIAASGEFRSNLHLGGTAESAVLDPETEQLALAAVQAHGLGVAGVDILQSNRGPLLLEVNSSPGLEGIEQVTRIDVAVEIITYLEREMVGKQKQASASSKSCF